jgi:hypothetical protein
MDLNEAIKQYREFRKAKPKSSGWFYGNLEVTSEICDAYLAAHPPDDDEPITAVWLQANGWGMHVSAVSNRQFWRLGLLVWVPKDGVHIEFKSLPHITTRSQLRALVKAIKGE